MWILNTTFISQKKKTILFATSEPTQDCAFSSNKHSAKSKKEVQGKEAFVFGGSS
jgi:hypothetical protein